MKQVADASADKLPLWHAFLEGLMDIQDDLVQLRCDLCLNSRYAQSSSSSGSYPYRRTPRAGGSDSANSGSFQPGLLGIISEQRSRNHQVAYANIRLLMAFAERSQAVCDYLFKNRREVAVIDEFLENLLSHRISAEIMPQILDTEESKLPPDLAAWKRDPTFRTFATCRSLIERFTTAEKETGLDKLRERELLDEIQAARQAVWYYKSLAPGGVAPHRYTLSLGYLEWVSREHPDSGEETAPGASAAPSSPSSAPAAAAVAAPAASEQTNLLLMELRTQLLPLLLVLRQLQDLPTTNHHHCQKECHCTHQKQQQEEHRCTQWETVRATVEQQQQDPRRETQQCRGLGISWRKK
jgi:hypothetical protein